MPIVRIPCPKGRLCGIMCATCQGKGYVEFSGGSNEKGGV